jgi:hypothetical protein
MNTIIIKIPPITKLVLDTMLVKYSREQRIKYCDNLLTLSKDIINNMSDNYSEELLNIKAIFDDMPDALFHELIDATIAGAKEISTYLINTNNMYSVLYAIDLDRASITAQIKEIPV